MRSGRPWRRWSRRAGRGGQAAATRPAADARRHSLAPPQRRHLAGLPAGYGPWWRAAQLFVRWSRLGAWQRLLVLAQARGVELGLAFLDGSTIRAHPKAAGARKRGPAARRVNAARPSAARAAASARKPASSPTAVAGRSPSR